MIQGSPKFMAFAALLGLAPLIVMLFTVLSARRAMIVGSIITAVLMPNFGIDLPGLPSYNKYMAGSVGILIGTLMFDTGRLLSFRPRWFDLPMTVFCLTPYATAISNDLGPYEGLSCAFAHIVIWLLPYFIGRLYLTDAESFRELAIGMIVSAAGMIPFCFLEMMLGGGRLQRHLYGTGSWAEITEGGFRPRLFFEAGLALGLWMNTATLAAWWLWRSRRLHSLCGFPVGSMVLPGLLITSIVCRARGAILLGLAGWFTLWYTSRYKSKWVIWALLAVAPTYHYIRITKLWTGESLVNFVEATWSKGRAHSIDSRFRQEDVIIVRAMKRPMLGWGRDDRMRVIEEEAANIDVPTYEKNGVRYLHNVDSFWSIVFGEQGFTGLATMTIAMILPVILFIRRFPVSQWDHPGLAPITGMTVILALFLLDGLSNGFLNPIYIIIAGGVVNINPSRFGLQASTRGGATRAAGGGRDETAVAVTSGSVVPGSDLAGRYQSLGRDAKDRGQSGEAAAAWQHALDLLTELLVAHPEHPALRRCWCDCANDLAWLLTGAADPAVRDPAGAVALAERAVEMDPECSTYWNTLGAAHYRAGDFQAAIANLNQATALSSGGTAFDHVFLAMAHARLGEPGAARGWFDLVMTGLGQHPQGHAELRRLCEEARSLLPGTSADL
jgi:hypothetical protein